MSGSVLGGTRINKSPIYLLRHAFGERYTRTVLVQNFCFLLARLGGSLLRVAGWSLIITTESKGRPGRCGLGHCMGTSANHCHHLVPAPPGASTRSHPVAPRQNSNRSP